MYFIVAKNIDLMLNSFVETNQTQVNCSLLKLARGDNGRKF